MSSPVTDPKRVLMLTTNFPKRVRGDTTGTFVYDLAHSLSKDHDVLVVAPHDQGTTRSRETVSNRFTIERVRYFWPRRFQRLAYGFGIPDNIRRSRLARIQLPLLILAFVVAAIRRSRDRDLIICHWTLTALAALPTRSLRRIPIVLVIHGADIRLPPRWFTRWLLNRVDRIVSAHDDLLEFVDDLHISTPTRRIRNLTGPLPRQTPAEREELRHELGLGEGPYVVFVGRLSEFKDPITLVHAAPNVLAEIPMARFLIVGDGPLRPDLEKSIDDLDLQDAVTVTGHRSDVLEILGLATVFVAISPITNLWSTTLIEAMRAGIPCVVSDAGGAAAVLAHRQHALLVPPQSPPRLAEAIVELLSDPELRLRIARTATAFLKQDGFLPDQIEEAWRSLLKEVTVS